MLERFDQFFHSLWLSIGIALGTSVGAMGQAAGDAGIDPRFGNNFRFPRRVLSSGMEPFGAEEVHDEHDRIRIPEPMVFDLVRPLGAQRGEAEINTLAIIPLNRGLGRTDIPDAIGIVPDGTVKPEWAPEIEWAPADGFALEFELPFEEWSLRAYKSAAQITFGTGFEDRFIHGAQGILLYDKFTGKWSPTLLYVAGFQFDEYWSALGMFGFRTEIDGDDRGDRTSRIFNLSIFRHVGERTTLGVETNTSASLKGESEMLLMPQVHCELEDHWMLQFGAGCSFTKDYTLPESAFRLIYSF